VKWRAGKLFAQNFTETRPQRVNALMPDWFMVQDQKAEVAAVCAFA